MFPGVVVVVGLGVLFCTGRLDVACVHFTRLWSVSKSKAMRRESRTDHEGARPALSSVHAKLGLAGYGVPIALLDIAVFGGAAATESKAAFPGYHGNKELEFLGDRVLKLVHGEWVAADLRDGRIQGVHPAAQELEMNRTFRRYLLEMGNVCGSIVNPQSKACANIFEAVVGCIYTTHDKGTSNHALGIVKHWLENRTPARRHRQSLWTLPK